MVRAAAGVSAIIAVLAGAAAAEACVIGSSGTVCTTAQLLADFNVIVGQDNNANDIGGPVLVGGNLGPGAGPLNFDNVMLGTTAGTTAITGYGEVNIFGNQTSSNNPTNGHVFVGGSTGSFTGATSVMLNYGFPPGTSPANNPTTFQTFIYGQLETLSTNLGGLTSPSMVTGTVNPVFTGVANANGVAVFSVPLSTLNSLSGTLSFAGCLAAATPCDAVIDVTGAGTLTQGFAFPLVATGFPNLIVNFVNDVTVDVGNVWTASILDPLGSVSATTDIIGNVVTMNYTNTAETHFASFDCSDSLCTSTPPPQMPEPGSLALLGAALASFGLLRRRRS